MFSGIVSDIEVKSAPADSALAFSALDAIWEGSRYVAELTRFVLQNRVEWKYLPKSYSNSAASCMVSGLNFFQQGTVRLNPKWDWNVAGRWVH